VECFPRGFPFARLTETVAKIALITPTRMDDLLISEVRNFPECGNKVPTW
jgi:hypothetical protein